MVDVLKFPKESPDETTRGRSAEKKHPLTDTLLNRGYVFMAGASVKEAKHSKTAS